MLGRLFARWRSPRAPLAVTLYTKSGCPLCDEMKAELARVRTRLRWELCERDIERDPELAERFALSVPVLEIAGKVAFKGRLTAQDFERKLARRAAEIRGAAAAHG